MKWDEIIFLDVEDVDSAHEAVLQLGGGEPGALNPGLIESATVAPRSGYYTSLAELAAVYAHGLAKNHGYRDGNKRTATLVLLKFLGANGYHLTLGPEWVAIIEGVATGDVDRKQLASKLTEQMGDAVAIES